MFLLTAPTELVTLYTVAGVPLAPPFALASENRIVCVGNPLRVAVKSTKPVSALMAVTVTVRVLAPVIVALLTLVVKFQFAESSVVPIYTVAVLTAPAKLPPLPSNSVGIVCESLDRLITTGETPVLPAFDLLNVWVFVIEKAVFCVVVPVIV